MNNISKWLKQRTNSSKKSSVVSRTSSIWSSYRTGVNPVDALSKDLSDQVTSPVRTIDFVDFTINRWWDDFIPYYSYGRDFSQWDVASSHGEDFENTLRAFEISQINQKQRKPRTSNFIGVSDSFLYPKSRLSWQKSNMNTIQEDDDHSSKSQDDGLNSCHEENSVTSMSERVDTKDEKI